MALDWLDSRRRAMLREMGIRVWQAPAALLPKAPALEVAAHSAQAPEAPASARSSAGSAPELIAARAGIPGLAGTFGIKKPVLGSGLNAGKASPAALAGSAGIHTGRGTEASDTPAHNASWTLGPLQLWQRLPSSSPQPLEDQSATPTAAATPTSPELSAAPRWLVVCEAADTGVDVQAGATGELLGNMLRAMQQALPRLSALSALPDVAANSRPQPVVVVQLAAWAQQQRPQPSQRQAVAQLEAAVPPAQATLQALLADFQPDIVLLLMGRMAAVAWLAAAQQNPPNGNVDSLANLPFNQLRSQPHAIEGGSTALVSHDLQSLLRTPARKAQAWEDLCQAVHISQKAARERWAKAGQS